VLYLLKSAGTNEYLQENLNILAVPDGNEVTIGYAARWVDPELWGQVRRGKTVCLIFGDRPYQWFVPVRRAEVVDVVDEAGELTLTIQLGPFARGMDLEAFSQRFAELNRRRFFVARDPKPELAFVTQGEDNLDDWKRIIEALQVSPGDDYTSRYARSVFLRYMSLCNANGQPFPPGGQLEVGQHYQQPIYCYTPGLEPQELSDYRLVIEPGSYNVGVSDAPSLPPDGELAVEIKPLEPGDLSLEVWVKPDRVQSTALRFPYRVIEAPAPIEVVEVVPEKAPPGLSERHLRAIFEVMEITDGSSRDQALLDLIDHVLEPLAQESHYLKERRALCLYQLGRWAEAYEQFTDLDPGFLSPQAVVAWFVSACRGGIDANLGIVLGHFNAWEQRALTDQLIAVLPMVEEGRRLQLLKDAWLGAGRYPEMWEAVRDTFNRPASILEAVNLMVDPDLYNLLTLSEGYRYLRERMDALGQEPLELLQRAVELGLQEPDESSGLDKAFLSLVERLLQRRGDLSETWLLVDQVRGHLSIHTWAEATECLAEALAGREEAEWRAHACELYVDLARICREQFQDPGAAEAYLTQAHHMVGDDHRLAAMVDAEEVRWAAVVERIEEVRLWRDGLTEVKRKRLRHLLSGKRAVFIGGPKRGFNEEAVRKELGLTEAEFVTHFYSERGRLDKVRQRISQGQVDYVIDFVRFGAHRNLEDDCQQAGVTYVRVPRSRSLDQIVRALARVHGIKLKYSEDR
jgi:hypothetical protein